MESLRQFLAFPMLATSAWLAWVLGQQAGIDAVFALAVAAVRERLTQLGVLPKTMGVDEFTRFFHDDIRSTVKLAKDINLAPTN